jgi:hypothetical protein
MSAARITSNGSVLTLVAATPSPAAALSAQYNNGSYRATPLEMPSWSGDLTPAAGSCDECGALQHETNGGIHQRADARYRRAFPAGPVLYLCRAHALAWQQRDDADHYAP